MSEPAIRSIVLAKAVGSPFCVSIEDGAAVHEAIITAVERGEKVVLSFAGVSRLTTAFLNAAVGQLYDDFDEARVREFLLPPQDATQEQLRLLVKVVENAKRFFADPERHRALLSSEDGE